MSSISGILKQNPKKLLKYSVNIWFVIVVLGQIIFAVYILGLYGVNTFTGNLEQWNKGSGHGYIKKDTLGNIMFGVHMMFALIVTLGGPMQLIKKFRSKFPKIHRINGRIYIITGFLISTAGLYLTWVRGSVGGLIGSIFITTNGLLIMTSAFFTIRYAVKRRFKDHRKWAICLFLAMSGVWFFRVLFILWITINQGAVGFDMKTFQGPALTTLYTFSYVFPILLAYIYFKTKESKSKSKKTALSIFILIATCFIAVGIVFATINMWIPRL